MDSNVNILLVDDQDANLLALEAILGNLGLNLVKVRSGEEALRVLLAEDFALVLLDVQMQGLDGFETAKLIREREQSRHTPIIFLTAHDDDPKFPIVEAYALGAVDYLVKPVVPAALKSKVMVFVELHRHREQTRRQDITRRERAEDELRQSTEWFAATLRSIGDAVIATDAEGRVRFMNRVAADLTGWGPEDAAGKPLADVFRILNEQTRAEAGNPVTKVLQTGHVVGLANHTVLIAKDGTERPIDDSAAPIRDESGNITGVVLVFHDVTEKRTAERELRESEARKAAILETALDCIITIDDQSRVIEWNPAAEKTFGYTRAEAVGQPMADLIVPPHLREQHHRGMAHYLKTGEGPLLGKRIQITAMRKGGAEFPVELAITAIRLGDAQMFTAYLADITERKQSEDALRQSEERFRVLYAALPVAAFVCDHNAVIQNYNRRAVELWGREPTCGVEQHCGSLKLYLMDGTLLPHSQSPMVEVLRTGIPVNNVEVFIERPDGSRIAVIVNFSALKDGHGNIIGAITSFDDITERKRAEEVLRQSQTQLQVLFDAAPLGVYLVDGDFRIRQVNPTALPVFGDIPDLTGRDFDEVIHIIWPQAYADEVVERFRHTLETGEPYIVPERVEERRDRGVREYYEWQINRIPLPEGAYGVVCYFRDISAQVLAREAVVESEARLRFMAESMPQKIFTAKPNGDVDYFNRQWTEFTGLSFEQIRDWGWLQFIHPDDVDENVRRWKHSIDTGEPFQLEHRFRRADGVYRWHLSRAHAMRDARGEVLMWTGSNTDIDDVKRDQEAAARRTDQLQRLAEVSTRLNAANDVNSVLHLVAHEARGLIGAHQSVTSMTTDLSGSQAVSTVSLSEKYAEWRGAEEQFDGDGIASLVCRRNEVVRLTEEELEGMPEWRRYEEAEPKRVPLRGWLAAPFVGRDGRNIGLIHLSDRYQDDFTEDDESILVQLTQMASVALQNARLYHELREKDRRKDEFLAMLAHELRNPLAAITNAVQVSTLSKLQDQIEWSMDVINRQIRNLARLIDDLLDVSRITRGKIELRKENIDATPVLNSAVETVGRLIEERKHELMVSFRPGLRLEADPTRLEQIIVNLLTNAAKYTESGGRIWLSANREGREVIITVRDTGVGIPPEKLPEMFELFAQGDRTLARSEGGLGIGLTLVRSLAEMHGGSVTATSEGPGTGSEFIVRLPAAGPPAKVGPRPQATPPQVAKQPSRILVVDDNVDTARGMAKLLKLLGHEVETAHDGPSALETARTFRPEYVLLDIGLPGMDGYQVASRLRREDSLKDIVIVAVSGYGQDDDRRRTREAGFDHHLVKPVDHDTLMAVLSRKEQGSNGR